MRTPTYRAMSIPMKRPKKLSKSNATFPRTLATRNPSYIGSSYSTAVGLSMEDFMAKDVFNCKCCRNSLYSEPESVEPATSDGGAVQPTGPEFNERLRYPGYDQEAFEAAWRRHIASRGSSASTAFEMTESTSSEPARVKAWIKGAIKKVFGAKKNAPAAI